MKNQEKSCSTIHTKNLACLLKEPYPFNLLLTLENDAPLEMIIPNRESQRVLVGIQYAISMLSEREKRIIELRFRERKTFRDIGEEFGVGITRAKHLTHLVLRRLRQSKLKEYYVFEKEEGESNE